MELLNAACVLIGLALAVIGQIRGWWESPRRKDEREKVEQDRVLNQAMAAALLGRAEIRDRSGGVLVKKELGLVAKHEILQETVTSIADQSKAIAELASGQADLRAKDAEHDAVIAVIIAHTFDAAARANLEAERLKAAKNNGAIDGEETE